MLERTRAAVLAELAPSGWSIEEPEQKACETRRIPVGHQMAFDALADQFGDTAHRGRYDWATDRHRLEQSIGRCFD